LDSPFAAGHGSEAAMRRQIESLEAKVDRLAEYLADLPSTQNETLRAAYEEGRLLQLEGCAAQDAEKHAEAIERFSRALPLAETDEQRAALYILRGNSYVAVGQLETGRDDYVATLDLSMKFESEAERDAARSAAVCNLGIVYFQLGDLDKAEELYREALAGYEVTHNRLGQANALGNLGNVYLERGELDKAEENYGKALAIHQETGSTRGEAWDLCNLGVVYAQRGDLDKAEKHFNEALVIDEESGDRLGQANALGNLGNVYSRRGELDKAEEYHKRALAIHEQIGDKVDQAADLGSLGVLAEQRGDRDTARQLFQQALTLYEQAGAGGKGPETVRAALERLEGP
jgi:tetratricopeptide (TPR) repeat protein